MKKITKILALLLIITLTSCDFIKNSFTYKETTENFVESLIQEDYEKSLTFMATEHEAFKNTNLDTLKSGFPNFRKLIVNNFGENLEYKFITANKTFSTVEGESTEPNTTKTPNSIRKRKRIWCF